MFQVYTLTDESDRVLAVGVSPGSFPEWAGGLMLAMLPYTFETLEAANAYREQLIKHYDVKELGKATYVIECDQTGERWSSVTEVVKHLGCAYSQMINHINRKRGHNTVRGLTYSRIIVPYETVKRTGNKTAIICNEMPSDRNVFQSVKDAAIAIGANPTQIFRHLSDPKQFRSVKGYTFSRVGEKP